MAGDWIPYEIGLPRKVEVRRIARATGLSRYEVSGRLLDFWGWASNETADGLLRGLDIADLVDLVGFDEAFWTAVVDAEWLRRRSNGLQIPNAERWLTKAAKARLQKNRRQGRWRDGGDHPDGGDDGDGGVDATPSTHGGNSRRPPRRDGDAHVDDQRGKKASTTEENSTGEKKLKRHTQQHREGGEPQRGAALSRILEEPEKPEGFSDLPFRQQALVADLRALTGETTGRVGYYRSIVTALPEQLVRNCMSDLRQKIERGEPVKSAGAILTENLKDAARRAGYPSPFGAEAAA